MISSTFGAPFGGTMRAGQYGFEPVVVGSIFPPNFPGGAGICPPLIDMVALGDPGSPYVCCAVAVVAPKSKNAATNTLRRRCRCSTVGLLFWWTLPGWASTAIAARHRKRHNHAWMVYAGHLAVLMSQKRGRSPR